MIDDDATRWKALREQVLKRDGWACRHCETTEDLQVHHRRYVRNRAIWDYPLEALITFCSRCHERSHVAEIPIYCGTGELVGAVAPSFELCHQCGGIDDGICILCGGCGVRKVQGDN